MGKDSFGLIDTHAHLTFPEFDKDKKEVLARAWEKGLEAIVVIGSGRGLEGNRDAVEFAKKHDNVYATVGIHPHDAESVDLDKAVRELRKLASHKKVVAIGEIGLDYYRKHSSAEAQRKCFHRLIELAFELKLPISIHNRDADQDIIYTLLEFQNKFTGGVFHCFSGNVEIAREVVMNGFYIAVPGVITFSKAGSLVQVIKEIPLEYMVLETDCPYLAPVPYRGKRNEPAYITYVAKEIAKLTGLTEADVTRMTTVNARRAFNLPGLMPVGKIAYPIRKSLYLNLTNRCTLECTFCPKKSNNFEVKGHNLKLTKEPDVEDVFRAIGDCGGYEEVVFCGFGEPTLRLEILKIVAKNIKDKGGRVRLDTDGLATLVHGRDVLPELEGLVDAISVSLNASDPETYRKLCPSMYGKDAFFAMLSFLEKAKDYIPDVSATVVELPGMDIKACKKLASDMGVEFRVRRYHELG